MSATVNGREWREHRPSIAAGGLAKPALLLSLLVCREVEQHFFPGLHVDKHDYAALMEARKNVAEHEDFAKVPKNKNQNHLGCRCLETQGDLSLLYR